MRKTNLTKFFINMLALLIAVEIVLHLFAVSLPYQIQYYSLTGGFADYFSDWKKTIEPDPLLKYRTKAGAKLIIRHPEFKEKFESIEVAGFACEDDGVEGPVFGLALGGMLVENINLPHAARWPEIIENLTKQDVVNYAVGDYGIIRNELAFLKFGRRLKPKVVLLGFYVPYDYVDCVAFDAWRQKRDRGLLTKSLVSAKTLIRKSILFALLRYQTEKILEHSFIVNDDETALLVRPGRVENFLSPRNMKAGLTLVEQSLKSIKVAVDKIDANLIVVIIPAKEIVYNDLINANTHKKKYDFTGAANEIINLAKNNSIGYLDLTPALKKEANLNQQLYLFTDNHLNARGNAVIANAVYDYLISEGLLK